MVVTIRNVLTLTLLLQGFFMSVISVAEERHPLQYSEEDLYFMTEALYFEARSEPVECQKLVAHVIASRVYSHLYPNTVVDVVWQHRQFSYTLDGKHEQMLDLEAKKIAEEVAKEVLGGYSLDVTEGALFYYNPTLATPKWKDDYTVTQECGGHLFLRIKTDRGWS